MAPLLGVFAGLGFLCDVPAASRPVRRGNAEVENGEAGRESPPDLNSIGAVHSLEHRRDAVRVA